MATGSSSKKVSRAAQAGGAASRSGSRISGVTLIFVLIIVLGVSLIVFSRQERINSTSPGRDRPFAPWMDASGQAQMGDTWFEAYGVYLCDEFAPNFSPQTDNASGIITNNDGIITISPATKKFSGRNATVGAFATSAGIKLTRNSVQMPEGEEFVGGTTKCGDQNSKFVVKKWSNAKDASTGEIIKADPNDVRLADNAAITIAVVPSGMKDEDIPLPPNAGDIDAVREKLFNAGQPPLDISGLDPNAGGPSADNPTVSVPTPAPSSETTAAP